MNIWAALVRAVPRRDAGDAARLARHGQRSRSSASTCKDNREAAAGFLKKIPVTYPSYDDPSGQVYNAEKLVGVPSTLFYDASGKQTFVHQGPYFDRAALVNDIRQYALR